MVILGANYLVENAVYFANFFKVPQAIIGIFIAIGTTMPEMSVAVAAARKGYGNIIIGNAIGSCVTNTLLILGVAALIFPLTVSKLTMWYTMPFLILMVSLFLLFLKSNWEIRKVEGIVFLTLYLIFLSLLLFGVIA